MSSFDSTAVIYARFSNHNQREESIEAQERACREYASRKGLQIIGVYADSAKSGTSAEREEFQKMIKDSGKKKFRYLIVHKLDSFSRDKYDSVIYKRKLRANGVKIISVVENLDASPQSLILESLLEGMAQYYSKNLAREVMKGLRKSVYDCKHLGGIHTLGYDVAPTTQKYVINEAEATIIRLIFEKYLSVWGYKKILDYLNHMRYHSKRGRYFGKNSLSSILTNEKYIGYCIFNKRQEKTVVGKHNPILKPKEEWIVIEGGIPAIIEQETFDTVQKKLSRNKRKSGSFKAKETYLFWIFVEIIPHNPLYFLLPFFSYYIIFPFRFSKKYPALSICRANVFPNQLFLNSSVIRFRTSCPQSFADFERSSGVGGSSSRSFITSHNIEFTSGLFPNSGIKLTA